MLQKQVSQIDVTIMDLLQFNKGKQFKTLSGNSGTGKVQMGSVYGRRDAMGRENKIINYGRTGKIPNSSREDVTVRSSNEHRRTLMNTDGYMKPQCRSRVEREENLPSSREQRRGVAVFWCVQVDAAARVGAEFEGRGRRQSSRAWAT